MHFLIHGCSSGRNKVWNTFLHYLEYAVIIVEIFYVSYKSKWNLFKNFDLWYEIDMEADLGISAG